MTTTTTGTTARFARTWAFLFASQTRGPLVAFFLGASLLGVWAAWAALARVGIYAASASARLEVDQAAHAVQAPVAGRVAETRLALNRSVRAGEVIFVLDASEQQLQLREQQALRASLEAQLPIVRRQIEAARRAFEQLAPLGRASTAEAQARARELAVAARHARRRASRVAEMGGSNLVASFDVQDTGAEADRRRAEADAAARAVERLGWDQRHRATEAEADLARFERDEAALRSQLATAEVAIARLGHDVELRTVRAPVDGSIGELATLRAGAFVQAGDRVATVVPRGAVRAVAEFAPSEIGRLRAGQRATMRLAGFPWTEFGAVQATVSGVADVVVNGTVRVELTVARDARSRAPLRHGITGTVEVETDRVSPLVMVLRAIGQNVGG